MRPDLSALLLPDRERPELFGEAVCIDCGELTPRRLPEVYPHICTACLFPPRDEVRARDLHGGDPRDWSQQLADLHRAVSQQRPRFFKPFGADLHGEGVPGRPGRVDR